MTFPKYERTVSDWLEERYAGDYDKIERELRLPSGNRIDFLLNDRVIVEVKKLDNWRLAIGQSLAYKSELKTIGYTRLSIHLELFGNIDYLGQHVIRNTIVNMDVGIGKVRFLTDITLLEDRR